MPAASVPLLRNALAFAEFVVLLALAGSAVAQAQGLRWATLTREHGLSDNSVHSIVEDRDGFLWIGSEDGLNRFDGVEFKVFKARGESPFELAEDYVNTLLIDRSGALWVGTFGGGLARYEPRRGVFVNHLHDPDDPRSLAHNDVSALHEDTAGTLWVGTRGGGLHRIDAGTRTITRLQLPGQASLPGRRQISALSGDGADGLWIGTLGAGLLHYRPADDTLTAHPGNATADTDIEITSLWLDTAGGLWIGSRRSGLSRRLADGTITSYRHDPARPGSLAHDSVNRVYEAPDGRIWISTTGGLDRFRADTGEFVHHRHDRGDPMSIPYDDVYGTFQDSLGTLWVGTGSGGLARNMPTDPQFTLLQHDPDQADGLSAGGAWSVLEDAAGAVWVGTIDGGVQVQSATTGRFRSYRAAAGSDRGPSDNDVRALVEDRSRRIWVGTRRGLSVYDRISSRFKHYLHDPADGASLAHDFVRCMLLDRDGTLWVGTYGGGLDRYLPHRDRFAHYRNDPGKPDSLSDDRVYSLLASRDGMLWIGTHGGGLNRLNPRTGAIRRYRYDPRDAQSIGSDRVLALQQDIRGDIWIGTSAGLDRYDAASDRFERQRDVPINLVYGIGEDRAGRLWLSTNGGLVRFDPPHASSRQFAMQPLIGNAEFNGGAWHVGASGRVYFGGVAGVVVVTPALGDARVEAASPVLTDFSLFNRSVKIAAFDTESALREPIEYAERIELTHRQSVFGFTFAALKATDPSRHLFSYRLSGLDDRWIETLGRQRSATFTNVPAGNYVFEARTTDADGQWLPETAQVRVRILPAPWRSPLAYALYALAIGLTIAYALRQRRLRARQKQLAQEALAASEERLKLALRGSGDELLDWDIPGRRMLRIGGEHGVAADHVMNSFDDFSMMVHRDDYPEVHARLVEHFAGRSDDFEASYRIRDGSGRWVWRLCRGRIATRAADGAPLRMTGTQQDISRIKDAEEALRRLNEALDSRVRERTADLEVRQQQLEGANSELSEAIEELQRTQTGLIEAEKMASLGRLVAGVAHEANTPLGVSVTALSFLKSELAVVKSALARHLSANEAKALMDPIDTAGGMVEANLLRAVNVIKSFKQVAVDQSSSDLRSFRLREYLDTVLQSLHPALRKANHQVSVECDPELEMTGRPDAMNQIIVNLIMNSITHAFAEGVSGHMAISVTREAELLRLRYADDGAGMEPAVASRIFEPFFTTKRGSGGTGLGMHIVYNLVSQALGGRIRVDTAPGNGVRIDILFPQRDPRARSAMALTG